jgi:hypothetical protein
VAYDPSRPLGNGSIPAGYVPPNNGPNACPPATVAPLVSVPAANGDRYQPACAASSPVLSIVAKDAEAAGETAAAATAAKLERWAQAHPQANDAQLSAQIDKAVEQLARAEYPGKGKGPVTAAYRDDAGLRLARHVAQDNQSARLVQAVQRLLVPSLIPADLDQGEMLTVAQNLNVLQAAVRQVGKLNAADRAEVADGFKQMAAQIEVLRTHRPTMAAEATSVLAQIRGDWQAAVEANPLSLDPASTAPSNTFASEVVDMAQYRWLKDHMAAYEAGSLPKADEQAFGHIALKSKMSPDVEDLLKQDSIR